MPIDYSRYPSSWPAISLAIRERAHWRCEWCGAAHGQPHPETGATVVLTVAHLGTDHADGTPGDKRDKSDVRPENLAALCQRCHLRFDVDEHLETRRRRERQQRIAAGQLEMF